MHTNEARTATTEVEHDDLSKLRELIAGVRFAGFTTIGPDGDLRNRPMTTQLLEPADQLWFLGAASSEVVADIVANPKVNVMYSDPDSARWVSVTGRASVTANQGMIECLWQPAYDAWFPGGKDDPDLRALSVDVDHVDYWTSPGNRLLRFAGLVRAMVTRQPAELATRGSLD